MQTVLFVCFHNAGRSQMAEAFFNHIAKERGLALRARSAGTVAKREINPVAMAAMEEVGISMEKQLPKQLMDGDLHFANRVITMHCGVDPAHCPSGLPEDTVDWNLEDPAGKPIETVRRIRDQIKARVESLIDEMGADA